MLHSIENSDTLRKVRRADSLVLVLNPAITDTTAQLSYLAAFTNRQKDACEDYWYPPDHLGSSSWVTDAHGEAVQHLHYLPWGEDFVDQRANSFDGVRYTFSAKEKDSETGLSYSGSRYYSSDLSIWLSVDPMSDKYPSLSPYVYCADNSVKLVDPNGDTISLLGDDWESALAHMQKHCPNLEISRGENGCLSYSYKKGVKFNQKGAAIVSDEETMFCKVIDSKEVKVSLTANYKNVYTAKNGKQYKSNMGGGFLGSTYNGNKTADAEQFVSMILLNKYYASEDIGRLLLHEATEAYWGGERAIELQRNTCVPQSNIFGQYEECGDYNYAHNKAISQPTTRFEKFMSRTSYDLLLYHLGKGH